MKIVIMGAGGVGGFYGGRMARGGEDVTFIARGEHLKALQAHGLHLESPTVGNFHLPQVNATDDPARVGPADLVWMTTKAYDLDGAARAILPLIGPQTVVIPLLNGIDNAERIGAVVGMEHMLGGVVMVSSAIASPGVIRHVSADQLVFGELAGGTSARGEAITAMLRGVGIEARLTDDIRTEIWIKYIRLMSMAGVTSLTRFPMLRLLRHPETRALFIACVNEGVALARKKGIAIKGDFCERFVASIEARAVETKPSMLLDLERGRRMELEVFQGAAMRLGRELGVPTPVNAFIHAALVLHANGRG